MTVPMGAGGVPDREPDLRISVWARERAVMIESDDLNNAEVVTVLRKLAKKIEQGGEGIVVGLN